MTEDYCQTREDWGETESESQGKSKTDRLYARIHDAREDYSHYAIKTELGLKLKSLRGMRWFIHVRLEREVPRIELTILPGKSMLAFDRTDEERRQQLGVVVDSRIKGTKCRAVGTCQAWYYPADRILVLWEVTLFESNKRAVPPLANKLLRYAWQRFEKWLIGRFPMAERIATPGWDPAYSDDEWSAFLTEQGYQPFGDERGVEKIINQN